MTIESGDGGRPWYTHSGQRLWMAKESLVASVGAHGAGLLFATVGIWLVVLGVGFAELVRMRMDLAVPHERGLITASLVVSLGLGVSTVLASAVGLPRRGRARFYWSSAQLVWRTMGAVTRTMFVLASGLAVALFVVGNSTPQVDGGAPMKLGSEYVLMNHGAIESVSEATYWRSVNGGWGINAAFIGGGFMLFAVGLLGIIAVRRGRLTD